MDILRDISEREYKESINVMFNEYIEIEEINSNDRNKVNVAKIRKRFRKILEDRKENRVELLEKIEYNKNSSFVYTLINPEQKIDCNDEQILEIIKMNEEVITKDGKIGCSKNFIY